MSGARLVVPGHLPDHGAGRPQEGRRPECDEGEAAQERRGGAPDGEIRPLPPGHPLAGRDAEVAAHLLERDRQLPARHEPGDDRRRGDGATRLIIAPGGVCIVTSSCKSGDEQTPPSFTYQMTKVELTRYPEDLEHLGPCGGIAPHEGASHLAGQRDGGE